MPLPMRWDQEFILLSDPLPINDVVQRYGAHYFITLQEQS